VHAATHVALQALSHAHVWSRPQASPLAPHLGAVTKVQPPIWVAHVAGAADESGMNEAKTTGVDVPPVGA
jgi:hypothetical protein